MNDDQQPTKVQFDESGENVLVSIPKEEYIKTLQSELSDLNDQLSSATSQEENDERVVADVQAKIADRQAQLEQLS